MKYAILSCLHYKSHIILVAILAKGSPVALLTKGVEAGHDLLQSNTTHYYGFRCSVIAPLHQVSGQF